MCPTPRVVQGPHLRSVLLSRLKDVLSRVVSHVPVGTHLGLCPLLWTLRSGPLLQRRGALIPACADWGRCAAAVRRAGTACASGCWSTPQFLTAWPRGVQDDGPGQAHRQGGACPVGLPGCGWPRRHGGRGTPHGSPCPGCWGLPTPPMQAHPRCRDAGAPAPSPPSPRRSARDGAGRAASPAPGRSAHALWQSRVHPRRGGPAVLPTAARGTAHPKASWSGRGHGRPKDVHGRPRPPLGGRPGRAARWRPPGASRHRSGPTSYCRTPRLARRPLPAS